MSTPEPPDAPETRRKIYAAYRSYFDIAERKRRWNVLDDIPWDQCNKSIDPVVADVIQTFCMVELYLPPAINVACRILLFRVHHVSRQMPPVGSGSRMTPCPSSLLPA